MNAPELSPAVWTVPEPLGRGRHRASRPLRIVAIGGGTGLPAVLRGLAALRELPHGVARVELSAIVAVTDDGGSSGRLRREQGVLAPGDLRNCLVALADPATLPLTELFQYRFQQGRGLRGHALGNLLLLALAGLEGDFGAAIERAAHLLRCRGRVLPCTLESARLVGVLDDGRTVEGESAIAHAGGRIERLELRPQTPDAAPGVLRAILEADLVVLGPGSLYTSVIAPLLVPGVAAALRRTGALRVLVQNLMTQPEESSGLDAAGHLRAVQHHAGAIVDAVLWDPLAALPDALRARYAERDQHPVACDTRALARLGALSVEADVAALGDSIRHDPRKVAAALLGLALESARA